MLGGNNAIKSNQEEFPETYVHSRYILYMYTISSHANSRMNVYKWVGSAKSFCLYIGKFCLYIHYLISYELSAFQNKNTVQQKL